MARSAIRRFSKCAFTQLEHERWEAGVGAYDKLFGPLTRQAAVHLAGLATQSSKTGRGLDCATGPGYVVEEALSRGAAGRDLVAVDFSAAMLSMARERIPKADVTWREADIQEPMHEFLGQFAWCTCNFGALHLARPEIFFQNVRHILQPGGLFAFTVWADLAKSPVFDIVLRAIQEHGAMDVNLPPGPPFFKYSDALVAKEDLVAAGFEASSVTSTILDMTLKVSHPDELWHGFYDGTARTGALLASQTPEAKSRIRSAIQDAVTDALQTPAPYVFKQPCVVVTAKVPLQ